MAISPEGGPARDLGLAPDLVYRPVQGPVVWMSTTRRREPSARR